MLLVIWLPLLKTLHPQKLGALVPVVALFVAVVALDVTAFTVRACMTTPRPTTDFVSPAEQDRLSMYMLLIVVRMSSRSNVRSL